jgi:hypothetical protein
MKKILIMLTLLALFVSVSAERININNQGTGARLISSDIEETIVQFNLGSFDRKAVEIDGQTFYQIHAKTDGQLYLKGQPSLPKFATSVIIPNEAKMQIEIIESEYTDYQMAVAPSKGKILRNVDPATVPYTFADSYENNEFFPENSATLNAPYIFRDYRGSVINVVPFAYNHQNNTLRVFTKLVVRIYADGYDTVNVLSNNSRSQSRFFDGLYSRFINFESTNSRYTQVDEHGRMIVIAYADFVDEMQPYVDWKNKKGIKTDLYNVDDIGSSATAIKTFIQNEYDENNDLIFVQLVGDASQIPTFTSGGGGSDPKYALLAGSDSYPEIFIGRFSAENEDQVTTQVERSIYYERDIQDADWLTRAIGVASSEGGGGQGDDGQSDIQHMNVIRDVLLDFTYTQVDQIYDPGASAAAVAAALNEGRGHANYVGHGSTTTWVTSGFSNSHINQLTNDNKLPFINSVACVNGNFVSNTCFAEAWMRATNNSTGAPTGAIGIFASTINQSWAPPMSAQDDAAELLAGAGAYDGQGNQKNTLGGIWYNSTMEMLDTHNASDMYETWHIFGDASLQVRTANPQEFNISHNPNIFIGLTEFTVNTGVENALVCISNNNIILGSGYTDASGAVTLNLEDVPNVPSDLDLTITAFNYKTSTTVVPLVPNDGAYVVALELTSTDELSYGETIALSLKSKNLGSENAEAVNVELEINDPYVTINDNNETLGDMTADQEITGDAFEITLANNIPDQYAIVCTLNYSDNASNTWSNTLNLTAVAPAFELVDFVVDDASANNNGVMEAGETVNLNVRLNNVGHATSPEGNIVISTVNSHITINTASIDVAAIDAAGYEDLSFEIVVANDAPVGDLANFVLAYTAGSYAIGSNYGTSLGLQVEDFESGDFSAYEWVQAGNSDWTVVSENHEGSYGAKSGSITHDQSSSISYTMTVAAAGQISFWKKVSSEATYDFLKFIIDGQVVESWSGNVAWSEETFDVEAGEHTFEWKYEKDYTMDGGQDCAWVDYIVFPAGGGSAPNAPVININPTTLDFAASSLNEEVTRVMTISNFGNAELSVAFELPENFSTDYVASRTRAESAGRNDREIINITIPAGGDPVPVTIKITPTESMDYSAAFNVASNDTNNPAIAIQLNADFTSVSNDNTPVYTTEFKGNYPNPFNPTTTIAFSLEKASDVAISIYNIRGQKVKTVVNGKVDAGNHNIQWHGKDDNGKNVGSGIYFMKLDAKNGSNLSAMRKMILMK